jgi:predicted MFS family arabinose efflux permease
MVVGPNLFNSTVSSSALLLFAVMQTQLIVRGRRRSQLCFWSSVLIAGAVAVAATIIYQVLLQCRIRVVAWTAGDPQQ